MYFRNDRLCAINSFSTKSFDAAAESHRYFHRFRYRDVEPTLITTLKRMNVSVLRKPRDIPLATEIPQRAKVRVQRLERD